MPTPHYHANTPPHAPTLVSRPSGVRFLTHNGCIWRFVRLW
ncbi:hypothetical protein [Moraxella lacunata]